MPTPKHRPDTRPPNSIVVDSLDTHETHIIPLTKAEAKELLTNGEMFCNEHEETPLCFCGPYLDVADLKENTWIHREVIDGI